MKNQGLDHAKETIRKALVYEYIKKHPGIREQDVVLACKNGELIFMEISTVLADTELRTQSTQIFKQAVSLFSELAIHQDERWNECIVSIQHSMQMIDCLHSSLFGCFTDRERVEQEKFLKGKERTCARITVSLHETNKEIRDRKGLFTNRVTPEARGLVLHYLTFTVDQLSVLHEVLSKEIHLGDLFYTSTQKFLNVQFNRIRTKPAAFRIKEIGAIYEALKGNKRASMDLALELNKSILQSTKQTLGLAVDELSRNLCQRRKRIQEIWVTISNLQITSQAIGNLQILEKEGKLPPIQEGKTSPLRRMVRFLNRLNQ